MHERVAERLRNNRRKHPPTTSVVIRPAASSSHLLLIVIVLIIILPFSRLLVSFGSLALGPPPRLGLGLGALDDDLIMDMQDNAIKLAQ